MGAEALYLSFDGITDPLGRSQVLPYLAGPSGRGHGIRLVSLEKPAAFAGGWTAADAICRAAGIEWWPLPYRSRPPIASGIANLRALQREAERLHRERPADFVHCRADLPAIAGLALKRRHALPLLTTCAPSGPTSAQRAARGTNESGSTGRFSASSRNGSAH